MKSYANAFRLLCVLVCICKFYGLRFPSSHSTGARNRIIAANTFLAAAPPSKVAQSTTGTGGEITAKSVTNEIIEFFGQRSSNVVGFQKRLNSEPVKKYIDGLHVITILFQSARSRRMAKDFLPLSVMYERLKAWNREWSERDISMFVYGVRSLDGFDPTEGQILKYAAEKITESKALLTSRSIGNALYGLQEITSDMNGAPELCGALAEKIAQFKGDLNGQDIGIGLYGLQGMSADVPEVRKLIEIIADKISKSVSDLDAQALSNALYGLQSMSSDFPEVRKLVSALASKVAESNPDLLAQAIGSACYGLQLLSSEHLEVRTLVSALAEKIELSTVSLDAQAIGNALFGFQRLRSNVPEVRALVQAIATKIANLDVQLDSKAIGSALYGLRNMSSDVPQVRALLLVLAERISACKAVLSGQGIADALYGLMGMTTDCPELRSLLRALSERIDATKGKLESQEIGNALYGLQGLSSDMPEVRSIALKLAEKIKRSKATLLSQHIGRALLGLQRLGSDTPEIRYLVKQLSKRIAESDRIRLTSAAIADSLYGLQGMSSDVPEVQELLSELAKKISSTAALFSPDQIGKALFGLQGMSSSGSIIAESAIGIDSDEVTFLLSTLWDKVKVVKEPMSLGSIALGLQGISTLRDPIAENLRQYLYYQLLQMDPSLAKEGEGKARTAAGAVSGAGATAVIGVAEKVAAVALDGIAIDETAAQLSTLAATDAHKLDVISTVRGLRLNGLLVPKWLAEEYIPIEEGHVKKPVVPQSRADKLVVQRYAFLHSEVKSSANALVDGFRLDLWFPDVQLNVELDGPAHMYPARARFDTARDAYLTKKGIDVLRIKLFGKSVDDVIGLIQDRVFVKADKVEDEKIQKIYASETEIRKIYSPRKGRK